MTRLSLIKIVILTLLLVALKSNAQNILWKGETGFTMGDVPANLSPDTSLLVLKGIDAFTIYSTELPMKVVTSRHTTVSLNTMPCFSNDGRQLFVVSPTAVYVYEAPNYTLKNFMGLQGVSVPSFEPSMPQPTLRYFAADTSIVVLYRDNSRGGPPTRLKMFVRDSGCTVVRQDSIMPGSEVSSPRYLCRVTDNQKAITVTDMVTFVTIDSFAVSGQTWFASTNGHYVAYIDDNGLVVRDCNTKSTHATFDGYSFSGFPGFSVEAHMEFINDSLLFCTTANTILCNLASKNVIASIPMPILQWFTIPSRKQMILLPGISDANECTVYDFPQHSIYDSAAKIIVLGFDGQIKATNSDTALIPRPDNVEYSGDGRLIAVQENYQLTKIADASTGRVLCHIPNVGVFDSDAQYLYCYENDSLVAYSTSDASRRGGIPVGHKSLNVLLAIRSDGKTVCVASAQRCSLFDLHSGVELQSIDLPAGEICAAVHYANHDSTLLLLSTQSKLYRWSTETMTLSPDILALPDSVNHSLQHFAFSSDGSRFVRELTVFSCDDGKAVYTVVPGDRDKLCDVRLSHDGTFLFRDFVSYHSFQMDDAILEIRNINQHTIVDSLRLQQTPPFSDTYDITCFHHRIAPNEERFIVWQDCLFPIECVEQKIVSVEDACAPFPLALRCTCSEGLLHIDSGALLYSTITISSLLGQVLFQQSTDAQSAWRVPVSNWPEGAYLVCLSNSKTSVSCTALVMR